jgi:hypothetical protein
MTDQVDTSQLVGSGPAARQSEPHVDPAVALDPVKTPTPEPKPAKVRRPPAKKRAKATTAAKDAGQARRRRRAPPRPRRKRRGSRNPTKGAPLMKRPSSTRSRRSPSFRQHRGLSAALRRRRRVPRRRARRQVREELVPGGQDRVTFSGKSNSVPKAPPARVTEAWLIAANGEAVCCDLGMGLPSGGGHHAEIPAGHLLF